MRALLASALGVAVLVAAGAARAHVTASPAFVEAGEEATLSLEVPNERDASMSALEVEAVSGVELVGSSAPAGWATDATAGRATWSGSSLPASATATFAVTVRAGATPGPAVLRAVQVYPDGGRVPWQVAVTVVPAAAADPPDQHLGRALLFGAAGVVVLGSVLAVRTLRRRSLHSG